MKLDRTRWKLVSERPEAAAKLGICAPARAPPSKMLAAARRPVHAYRRLLNTAAQSAAAAARPDVSELTAILEQQQRKAAKAIVPWFVEQMPDSYFRQVSAEAQRGHLRAITAFSAQGFSVPELALTDGGLYTFLNKGAAMTEGQGTSRLEEQLKSLPADASLNSVLIYQSADGQLSLNMFETGGTELLFTGEGEEQQAMTRRPPTLTRSPPQP